MTNMPRNRGRGRVHAASSSHDKLLAELQTRIIGQTAALETLIPPLQLYRAGLSPSGRPLGAFMLLGPTGVGKTATVEALAEVIHGSAKNVLRIDCGEYQMEHEVAKLIGAPPGYLGHRETQPVLTQMKLNQVMSDRANVAIVLFDEIEKAAPSLTRLLLGILDKGTLRLGDNTTVQFERTLIFLTSNLGAGEMNTARFGGMGFENSQKDLTVASMEAICKGAIQRKLPPEFINRIDGFVTYTYLTPRDIACILEKELRGLNAMISERLQGRSFEIVLPQRTREWISARGFSPEYGARPLKRLLATELLYPLANYINDGLIAPGSVVTFTPSSDGESLVTHLSGDSSSVALTENGSFTYRIKTS